MTQICFLNTERWDLGTDGDKVFWCASHCHILLWDCVCVCLCLCVCNIVCTFLQVWNRWLNYPALWWPSQAFCELTKWFPTSLNYWVWWKPMMWLTFAIVQTSAIWMKMSSMCGVTIGMGWVFFLHSMCGKILNWVSRKYELNIKYLIISSAEEVISFTQAPPYSMHEYNVSNDTQQTQQTRNSNTTHTYLSVFVLCNTLHNMAKPI